MLWFLGVDGDTLEAGHWVERKVRGVTDARDGDKEEADRLHYVEHARANRSIRKMAFFLKKFDCPLREGGSSPSRPPFFEVLVVRASPGKPLAPPTPSPYERAFETLSDSCISPLAL